MSYSLPVNLSTPTLGLTTHGHERTQPLSGRSRQQRQLLSMATYAIGDVQGCYQELRELIATIAFDPLHDRLWFVGDLVNRGPASLEVLRYVRDLGDRAVTVLGNHDLHLVALALGSSRLRGEDTLEEVLKAPDRDELISWLRGRPMLHAEDRCVMVHAGLLPQWSVDKAENLAREVEVALRG